MTLTFSPVACSAVTADSRPAPGPFTRTSTSLTPNFDALAAHSSAARWAANGGLLRLPLNPTVPADAAQRVSPLVSVIVTIVLLNVLCTWAIPRLTLRRGFFFLLFALGYLSLTPFLPATVLRTPLRVRALVFDRWPRTGRFFRCRSPRYALISLSRW